MYCTGWAYPPPPLGQSLVIAAKLLKSMLGTTIQELHEPFTMKPCTMQKQLCFSEERKLNVVWMNHTVVIGSALFQFLKSGAVHRNGSPDSSLANVSTCSCQNLASKLPNNLVSLGFTQLLLWGWDAKVSVLPL